jgi:hypothetical protein
MNVTDTMRKMRTGEVVVFEACHLGAVRAAKTRLRAAYIVDKADWAIGEQNPCTGQFNVRRITRLD